MRIAFFTDSFHPNVDGVVRSLDTNRAALQRRGHFVSVYASGSRAAARANRDSQVHYYTGFSFPFYKQYKIALHPFQAIKTARKEKIQVVHCHALASMGVTAKATARALHLPLVGTFHTLVPHAAEKFLKPRMLGEVTRELLWRACSRFYKKFCVVTAPSMVIKRELENHGVDAPLCVVPNPVDCNRFKPASRAAREKEKKKWCPRGEALVLVAGRLSKEKNVDVIIRALPLVQERIRAKLVVTGEGPAKPECLKLARRLALCGDVLFPGFVDEGELPLLYSAADCIASASTFETQGLVLLEAMACGTPAVAARALAFKEEVRDNENGFLFKPNDASDCAEKILRILEASKGKRARLSDGARETARRVDVPLVARRWEKLYAEFV
ncbi:MAG: glycosyltransferase [Candidatus Norongarragalinales archaeon]